MTEEYKNRLAQERVNQVSGSICKALDGIPTITTIRAWVEYDDGDVVALQIDRKDHSASQDPEPERPARPNDPKKLNWLRKILPFLATLPLLGASTTIDCGSSTDSGFSGGTAQTISGSTLPDQTVRFSSGPPFSYRFVVTGPTQVTLRFTSLPQTPASIFSVQINNQTVVDHLDLAAEGGLTQIIERNVIVSPDGTGVLQIVFIPIVRAAVVSSITLTPLQDLLPTSGTSTPTTSAPRFNIDRTSDTRLTVNGAATSERPAVLRIGTIYPSFNGSATIDLPLPQLANHGSIRAYMRWPAPHLEISYQGINPAPVCAGMNCIVVQSPSYPADGKFVALAEWLATIAGKWDAVGIPRWPDLSIDQVTGVSGIGAQPQSDGTQGISVDGTVVRQ